jgi:hypothetical protein
MLRCVDPLPPTDWQIATFELYAGVILRRECYQPVRSRTRPR